MRPLALVAILLAAPAFAQQQPALRQVTPTPGSPAAGTTSVTPATSPAAAQIQAQQRTAAALRTAAPAMVNIGPISARDAAQWIATVSDLPLVVNWDKLAIEGIDAAQQVQLSGVNLTAEGAIHQLMQQVAVENNLIMEVSPWYVEIMTKTQAAQNPVIIVYPIGDLMMTIPNFTDAPEFDLSAISQGGGGRGGGGGGSELFTETQEEEIVETELERGGRIADMIRQTIEPDLWRENGGLYGSITYFNKHLIVRAPMYIHRQIGGDGIRAGSAGRVSPAPGTPGPATGAVTPAPGTLTGVSSYVNVTSQLDSARVQSLRRVPVFTPLPRNQQFQPTSRRGSNVGITPSITRVR